MANPTLRIVSLNILAPELLQFFWRSSYGLPLLPTDAAYGALTARRLSSVAGVLSSLGADVVVLQETTDTVHTELGGRTTASYLAFATGLVVAGESFKRSRMAYGVPPREQVRGAGVTTMDSGVATLYNPRTVAHVRAVAAAEDWGGRSAVFPTGVGSPFRVDAFAPVGGGAPVCVMNVHVKMQWPHIRASLAEALQRAGEALERGGEGVAGGARDVQDARWTRVVVAGDLNAKEGAAAEDLRALLPPGGALMDAFAAPAGAPQPPPADDHVLLGPGLAVVRAEVHPAPLLAMCKVDGPTSDAKWARADTRFTHHAGNAELLAAGVTSDHPPLVVDVRVVPP